MECVCLGWECVVGMCERVGGCGRGGGVFAVEEVGVEGLQ